MKINLFVVESPLQLLSAIEASSQYVDKSNVLVVRYGPDSRIRNNAQIKLLIDTVEWDKIIEYRPINGKSIRQILSLKKFLSYIKSSYEGSVDNMYMGEFRSDWMHYVRSAVAPKETYLLDDGAVTIRIQKEFLTKKNHLPGHMTGRRWKSAVKKIVFKRFLQKNIVNKRINLFTAFNITSIDGQIVHKHNFDYVRKLFSKGDSSTSSKVLFFGSKYSESKIISLQDEIQLLLQVKKHYEDEVGINEITYVAHRDESADKLGLIEKVLTIPVIKPDLPGELFLLDLECLPSHIGGFYTSLLPNSKVMFPSIDFSSFRIPVNIISPHYVDSISVIYDFYKDAGLKLTQINYDEIELNLLNSNQD
ncbi:polysialyltransferase family glycosyltransferase [Aliidiomarina sp. Khilg15.8]